MEKLMNLKEMEKILKDNNEKQYNDIMVDFEFNKSIFNAQITFAYFNTRLDSILKKYKIEYDDSYMLTKKMTIKNYKKYMNELVQKMYDNEEDILSAQSVLVDILDVITRMIRLFNSGSRVSIDVSLTSIFGAMKKDKKIYDLFMENHINKDMTPEELSDKRDEILKRILECDIPGITPLLKSGSGIKADQLINMFFGLFMRVKPSERLDEIYPRVMDMRWVDGLNSIDSHFIETSIQRLANILNSQTMASSGTHNKSASILAQDTLITMEDCGSVNYQEYEVKDEGDLRDLKYKYYLNDKGEEEEITENHTNLIGRTVKVRSVCMCAAPYGQVCARCFGANAKWNTSTKEYRYDVGFVAARKTNSAKSQKVLSVKHTSTPTLVRVKFTIINYDTGEMIYSEVEKCEDFFTRKFNKLIFNEGVRVFFEGIDVERFTGGNRKGNVNIYNDSEFGEYDIIRVKTLYLEKDGVKYILEANSPFRLKGYNKIDYSEWSDSDLIEVNDNIEKSYVIKNSETVMDFRKLQAVYSMSSKDLIAKAREEYSKEDIANNKVPYLNKQIEYMTNTVRPVVKGDPVVCLELSLRNKIFSKDGWVKPNWKIPNPEYAIYPVDTSIYNKPSISAVLSKGRMYDKLVDKKYYDKSNLQYSVFDLLFQNTDDKSIDEVFMDDEGWEDDNN